MRPSPQGVIGLFGQTGTRSRGPPGPKMTDPPDGACWTRTSVQSTGNVLSGRDPASRQRFVGIPTVFSQRFGRVHAGSYFVGFPTGKGSFWAFSGVNPSKPRGNPRPPTPNFSHFRAKRKRFSALIEITPDNKLGRYKLCNHDCYSQFRVA